MRTATQFLQGFILTAVVAAVVVFASIVIVDPYMNLDVFPIDGRKPVSQNQRFAYPALARSAEFNSVLVGTSTTRLVDPAILSDARYRFANLSMNSATAYEQERILNLFLRHHQDTRAVIVGVDRTWCQQGDDIEKLTFRAFPEWMYDDIRVNDFLFMFNDKALENTVRMAQLLLGSRQPKYRQDGYRDFTLDFGMWRLEQVRERIYRGTSPSATVFEVQPEADVYPERFPLVNSLRASIAGVPTSARIIVLLPPLHQVYVARHFAELSRCKGAVLAAFRDDQRVTVLDYLFTSEITASDENYWDQLHFTRALAQRVEEDIRTALNQRLPPKYRRYGAPVL